MAHFASQVKTDWTPDPDGLARHSERIARKVTAVLRKQNIKDDPLPLFRIDADGCTNGEPPSLRTLPPEKKSLLLTNSISPLPLHKTLVLLETMEEERNEAFHAHQLLALAKAIVYSISNLHFGPEVGVGPPKADASVIGSWQAEISATAQDLRDLKKHTSVPSVAHHADSRHLLPVLEPESVDAVITSPPYPNEKDYTRTTRLESVLLGMIRTKADLRALKKNVIV